MNQKYIFNPRAVMASLAAAGLLYAGAVGAETLKIGVIAALTGGGAPWGMAAAEGPRILAERVNAAGGLDVGGKKVRVEVIAYDDQYKAAEAVAAYNRLVNQDGVKYVIILSSAATMALKQNVEDDKVIGMSSAYTSKALDKDSRFMFRMYSAPEDYLPSMIGWMKDNLKGRRVVVVNPNDETGWDQVRLSEAIFKEKGFEVLGHELFERAQKDFQPMLTRIIAMKPDMIELGGTSPATAGLIIRQARELGYDKLFTKTGGAGPKEIVAGAGAKAAEGTINMLYADPANKGYQDLAAEYKKRNGHDANEIIVSFYDGANAILHAVQKAGTLDDTEKVAESFKAAMPFKSVQGEDLEMGGMKHYGIDHQVMTVNYIGEIRNGEPVVLGKTSND
ncbi:ABC transporter substrate-binding protein [Castellaniella denitrificans]|uniref:ABC transporter substrate-binding protein n=1 Tax=Castellaniella denitrificans TaxID=56119 RepID=UPI001AD4199C|nr:ABC transporter substrate-binding protein [Burkholderiales bacterium]